MGSVAAIKTKNEFVGMGTLIQFIGLICPFVFGVLFGLGGWILGILAMLILFVVGHNKARSLYCGNCGNAIASRDIKICPICKENFK